MGNTNTGKSTLINNIIGSKVLGANACRETANFTQIMLNPNTSGSPFEMTISEGSTIRMND